MHDAPRQTLRELIARHGPGLCSDARRCEGLLRDLCGAHRREINILTGALRERVPLDLLASQNSVPRGLLLTRLSKRLEEHLALTEEAARWAVDSWALALGVISDAELKEREDRRAEDAAPRAEASAPRPTEPPQHTPQHSPTTRARPTPPPAPTQSPRAPSPKVTRSPAPPPAMPPARPNAQGSATVAARRPPSAPPARAPSSPRASNTGPLQMPSPDPSAGRGRGRRRGCLLGCLLLILLSVLLFVGGPFVLNLLREEQRQRSIGSPPVQTR